MSTVQIRIGPTDDGRAMTLDEFIEAEEEPGYRYELARGVLEVTQIPADDHWQVLDNLHEVLSRYRRDHPGVIVRIGHGSEVRYVIPEVRSGRHPDVAVVVQGDPRDDRGRFRPSLAVEVVSPGKRARTRDYEDKRADYLVHEFILEYWIVDPAERVVTVLVRRGVGQEARWEQRMFREDEAVLSERLADFGLLVRGLWEGLDEDRGDGGA